MKRNQTFGNDFEQKICIIYYYCSMLISIYIIITDISFPLKHIIYQILH